MKSLQIVSMPGDGHCFQHSFLQNLSKYKKHHQKPKEIRNLVGRYLEDKQDCLISEEVGLSWKNWIEISENTTVKEYCNQVRRSLQGGEIEALVLAKIFGVSIQIRVLRRKRLDVCQQISKSCIVQNPSHSEIVFALIFWPDHVHYDSEL